MRGSVYVKIKAWIVRLDGTIDKRTLDTLYGHSSVGEMNTQYQREYAYQRALNQALKFYRNKHNMNSDIEINYRVVASGIINKRNYNGKQIRQLKSTRISASRKRQIHQETNLGKDKPLTRAQLKKQNEVPLEQYNGETMKRTETNTYVVNTGRNRRVQKKKLGRKSKGELIVTQN